GTGFNKKTIVFKIAGAALLTASALYLSSCVPTYPKEKLPEAIKDVCGIEYNMDVDVAMKGSTLGIYYPMEGLLDPGMGISSEAWDKISNLILIASRVVLSTDADIKFYCVVTQDLKLPEIQLVIIKYVEDVKRGMYRNISRNESFKRTLFSMNLTPQAEKEKSVDKVFNKLGLDAETRESVLNEFFRSPPTRLSDIGYWREHFYLKDIRMGEFLAAQIANRIKIDFRGDRKLSELYQYQSAEGAFSSEADKDFLLIRFKIFDQQVDDEETDLRKRKIEEIIRITNQVMYGYKFKDFAFIQMEDQIENMKLRVNSSDIWDFNKKKLSVEDIVQADGAYF
ncbi:MAG: hypothetical protein KAS86_04255, partial [Candidatus Omnitrophica bacterium]|nr:hypothetical protein [Candidatus Omnitrophota bacterium]